MPQKASQNVITGRGTGGVDGISIDVSKGGIVRNTGSE